MIDSPSDRGGFDLRVRFFLYIQCWLHCLQYKFARCIAMSKMLSHHKAGSVAILSEILTSPGYFMSRSGP